MSKEKEGGDHYIFELYDKQDVLKPSKPSKMKTLLPKLNIIIAGIILVIIGFLSTTIAILLIVGGFVFVDDGFLVIAVGIIQLPFSVAALLGGIFTIKRKRHRLSILCAVLSIITFGNAILYFIPGFVAVILVFISEEYFDS